MVFIQNGNLMASHVCRRSFASNLYGILPTPLIMSITAHSTEKMLLNYIGKGLTRLRTTDSGFLHLTSFKKEKRTSTNSCEKSFRQQLIVF